MSREEILSAFSQIQEQFLRAPKIPNARVAIPADLWKAHAEDHEALLAEKAGTDFEILERDDGKFTVMIGRGIAKMHDSERVLFEETGMRTTAGMAEVQS